MHELPSTYAGCITTYCDPTAILSSFSQFDDISANHPEVFHTFGLHPHNAKYWNDRIASRLMDVMSLPSVVAFGEIGIDLTSEKKGGSQEDDQISIFGKQLELGVAAGKAIVVHFRGPSALLFDALRPIPSTTPLHLHCWGDPCVDTAQRLSTLYPNLCFGFTGMICANDKMVPLLRSLPPERLLLESDGPYMLPTFLRPEKGSRKMTPVNHPGLVPYVAEAIGASKRMSIDEVITASNSNASRLFKLAL